MSTLTLLAELKLHIHSENQEKSKKIQMKNLFTNCSRNTTPDTLFTSQPPPINIDSGPTIALSTLLVSEISASGLCNLVPDELPDDEPYFSGTENPIPCKDLFDLNSNHWVEIYDKFAQKHLAHELSLCELLNQDATMDKGAEVDVDEMTGEILIS